MSNSKLQSKRTMKSLLEILGSNCSNILSVIAVIVSITAIVFTRKNIKTQKYIDTVTNQRVKWIDTLRSDFSDIIAHSEMINYCHYIEQRDIHVGYEHDPNHPEDEYDYKDFVKNINNEKKNLELKNFDIVAKIELSIMRLNETDDIHLIKLLDDLKIYFQSRDYEKIGNELTSKLRKEIKIILKNEWEKVKSETIKGGNLRNIT